MVSHYASGITSHVKNRARARRDLIHEIPSSTQGPWTYQDLDQSLVTSGDLSWLREAGLITLHDPRFENQGNEWHSTPILDRLQEEYPIQSCASTGGILDCGGNRFKNTGGGLECHDCERVTPVDRARARRESNS